ncbi:hypothetical protein CTM61_05930 [Prevotella intermedia]|nr:hypothetical protein CTM61_05930 [Prevotella intermedia]
MLICAFPPHYQLVCANSYISSFSLISYVYGNYYLRVEKYLFTRKEFIGLAFLSHQTSAALWLL